MRTALSADQPDIPMNARAPAGDAASDDQIVGIRRALLSVSDKAGLVDLARSLAARGVEILSTGGSARELREAGVAVKEVSEHTGFPEIMDGRVKTLHPKIHGGLLARRDDAGHRDAMTDYGIAPIDLLVANLYPFEATLARGAGFDDCIENIDIGGPAMIRAAAKNHAFVTVVVDPADYPALLGEIAAHGGTSATLRQRLAARAFARTASYDAAIGRYLAERVGEAFPRHLPVPATLAEILRYGENPHQPAALYRDGRAVPGPATATQRQGKALSYNNIADADAAFEAVAEHEAPAIVIVKHANPCGVATAPTLAEAYARALACDPVSAFGGIVAANRTLDAATAQAITGLFAEVVIAPAVDDAARAVFAAKPNLRVLETGTVPPPDASRLVLRSVAGGLLVQGRDDRVPAAADLRTVTGSAPTPAQIDDLLFAARVAKHVRSNAIVFARDGATLAIGAGQMSRLDAAKIAVAKAAEAGLDLAGSAAASEAFFPFPDGLEALAAAGAAAVIQPGGSMRDAEVIAAADRLGVAMVFSGIRQFRH
jgi:phosphoribosylaminoimidazolecarboxamide formyltransferase/IMP cyclohydrolase